MLPVGRWLSFTKVVSMCVIGCDSNDDKVGQRRSLFNSVGMKTDCSSLGKH